jgi:hypothetical protein
MRLAQRHALPVLAACATLLFGSAAEANSDGKPWGKGVMMPSIGIGAGFGSELTTLNFGLGFGYFVVNGLRLGLSVSDTVFIYHDSIKQDLPGLTDQVTTNTVSLVPNLQFVFFRHRRFSPYAFAGVGPEFRNHGGGTVGKWVAGPGVYIGIVGPVAIDIGFGFSSKFPVDQCEEAFFYSGPTAQGVVVDDCSLNYGPRFGIVIGLGGGSKRDRRQREAPPEQHEWEPLPEPAPEPAPEPEPAPAGWDDPAPQSSSSAADASPEGDASSPVEPSADANAEPTKGEEPPDTPAADAQGEPTSPDAAAEEPAAGAEEPVEEPPPEGQSAPAGETAPPGN